MATQVILLQRVEHLGQMGDVVSVKPGYARNYLLPQRKALRASEANIAYFEGQKKHLEAENLKKKQEAEKRARAVDGKIVPLIRQASEAGQLFGSVTARDIAASLSEATSEKIDRSMVQMNQNYKLIGLFPIDVYLHPEVKTTVTINIARSPEEADVQAKTGKALIAEDEQSRRRREAQEALDAQALESVLEDSALEAEKEKQEDAAEEEAEAAKSAEKSKARAAKKKAKASDEPDGAEESQED